MIPYGRQDVNQDDIDAVVEVLQSDYLTQGPAVQRFEQAVCERVKANYAVAVNSATSALHIACLALGLGAGDWLWTVPNTFVASANCALYCGANVDFVDIDSATWNLSISKLEKKLAQAKKNGCLPKIVVPVHFAGQPCELESIWELSKEFGFHVLEDASHAIGASRKGEAIGNCRWSDITVFSFHPVKIITTGEGGMAMTNDSEMAERLRMLRSHGITRDPVKFSRANNQPHWYNSQPSWYYEQQVLGFNYRMTDIQATLGTSQLQRLDYFIKRRNDLARRYDQALSGLPLKLPTVLSSNISAFHLYVIRLLENLTPESHKRIYEGMRQQGIEVNLHYMPVHLQPYYRALGFTEGQFPEAEAYAQTAMTLPLFTKLSDQDLDWIVDTLKGML